MLAHACLRQEIRGMTKPKLAECRGRVAATRGFGAGPESSSDTLVLSGWAAQLGKVHPLARESSIVTTDARRLFRPIYHLLKIIFSPHPSLPVLLKSTLTCRETSYNILDPV